MDLPTTTDAIQSPTVSANTPVGADRSRTLEHEVMRVIGIVIVAVITGFAVLRWQTGDVQGAIINGLIVAIVSGTLLLGNTPQFRGVALNLFGLAISSGCLISALAVSSNGLLWALLALLVNSMTLSKRWALGLNVCVIAILTATPRLFDTVLHQASWATVAVLITAFSVMTMNHLRTQRHQLVRQANIDPLTEAGNRRLMKKHIEELLAERRADRRGGTLMAIDLDKFKDINDQHGHETGDKVLIEFVRSVYTLLRKGDGFYRMGGEEFVLLLRGMDEAAARSYLPRLHQRLSGEVVTPNGSLEFSAGVATSQLEEGEDWSAWLARADNALYQAKALGRNQLCFHEEPAKPVIAAAI